MEGENSLSKLKEHFAKNEVIHYVTCPYTPQRNGHVERRHRSMVKTGRSLLFCSSIPTTYWL